MKWQQLIFIFVISISFAACSKKQYEADSMDRPPMAADELSSGKELRAKTTDQGPNQLEIFLKRTPGVTVSGTGRNARVLVRGVNSFNSNTDPLFIIDDVQIGNSYSSAASFCANRQIVSVRVLKDSDASFYGTRGAGGVVIVKTK